MNKIDQQKRRGAEREREGETEATCDGNRLKEDVGCCQFVDRLFSSVTTNGLIC